MKRKDLRKVKFINMRGIKSYGFFHKWVVINDEVIALVEDECGLVHTVSFEFMNFIKESEE